MRPFLRRGAVACLAAATMVAAAGAQARPKTCLVLSGGGARGAAHVGVLKVLEEMRIPVDCITGTSMGSLVGGAYASGVPVADMEKLLGSLSTTLLFVEKPPRDELTMRRKLDDRTVLAGPELGVSAKGVQLPKGIVSGVQLEGVLRTLVRKPGYLHFDELPIPYRAVATDLVTGKAVVFDQGRVVEAMRASMSVPGAIAPAESEGRLMVDGGLTDNLPVGVARSMGAQRVIAVNLGTPLLRREELASVIGVTSQMINILTEQNVRASLASLGPDDILIEPELGDFSAGDFDNLLKTVPIGEAAARKVAGRLAALSVSPEEYARFQAARTVANVPTFVVEEIRVSPLGRVNSQVVEASLQSRPKEPLDQATLDRDMGRLYGTGDYERVNYSVVEEKGQRVLVVEAVEKSWGPDYLRLGLGFGTDFSGDSYFTVAASYRRTWLNRLGGEWRTDLRVGSTNRLVTEFYQPLFVSRALFVAPRIEFERKRVDLFSDSQRVARYEVRTRLAGIDLGGEFARAIEARMGVVAGNVDARLETGSPEFEPKPGKVSQGAATARLIVDRIDSPNFPRNGYAAGLFAYGSMPELGADQRYTRYDFDAMAAGSLGDHTLQLAVKASGHATDRRLPQYDQVIWGGFLQQSGYPHGSLMGQQLEFGRVMYYYKLAGQRFFEGAYAGFSLEAGRLKGPLAPDGVSGVLRSGALFIATDTPVGPLYFGYGKAQGGGGTLYLYLGRP